MNLWKLILNLQGNVSPVVTCASFLHKFTGFGDKKVAISSK